jgi:ATP-binding cassette subfamily C protein
LGGIAKLRVSGSEVRAFVQWAQLFRRERSLAAKVRQIRVRATLLNTFMSVAPILVLYWMVTNLPSASLSTGTFLAFSAAFGMFLEGGLSLALTGVSLIRLLPMWDHARPILDTVPEIDLARPHPGTLRGHIELSHVTFRYAEDGPTILHDVSLEAKPGEFIALVGPSGAGKSTLLRMLLGFDKATSGAVYYDGHDLATVDVAAVRRQIGVVLQNGRLIADDIYSNIVGTSGRSLQQAWDAACLAGMEEDLLALPMGIHTLISEGGGNLSGGQRQRLLIARALVGRPRILFFDEATSALDNRSQKVVSESLDALHATRIVVAHRLSTIIHADRIYVLEAGRVVEVGSYAELMAKGGLFYDLAKRQET